MRIETDFATITLCEANEGINLKFGLDGTSLGLD